MDCQIWPMDTVLHHSVTVKLFNAADVPQPKYDKYGNALAIEINEPTTTVVGAWQDNLVMVHYYGGVGEERFRCTVVEPNRRFNRYGNWKDKNYLQDFYEAVINRRIEWLSDASL